MNWFSKLDQSFIQLPKEISENPTDFFLTPVEVQALLKIVSHEKDWIIPSKNLCGSLRTSQRVRESLKNKGWLDYKVIRGKDSDGKFFTAGIIYDLTPLEKEIYIRRGILSGESKTLTEIENKLLSSEKSYEKQSVLFNSKIRTFIDNLSVKEREQMKTVLSDFIRIRYYIPSRYELFKWNEKYDIDLLEKYPSYIRFIFDKAVKEEVFLPFEIKKIMKNKEAITFFTGDKKEIIKKPVIKEEPKKEEVFEDDKEVDDFISEFMNTIENKEDKEMKNTTDYKKFGITNDQWENMVSIFPDEYKRRVSNKTINDMLRILDDKEINYDDYSNVVNALYYPYKEGYLVPEWDEIPDEKVLDVKDDFIDGLKKGMIYSSWSCNRRLQENFINYKERNEFEEILRKCDGKPPVEKDDKLKFVSFLNKIKTVYETCNRVPYMGCFWTNEEPDEDILTAVRDRMNCEREQWYQAFMTKKGFFENPDSKIDELNKFLYLNFGFITALGKSLYYPRKYYFDILDDMKKQFYGDRYQEIEEKYRRERDSELAVKKMPFDDLCYNEEKIRFFGRVRELNKDKLDKEKVLWGKQSVYKREFDKEIYPNVISDYIHSVYN